MASATTEYNILVRIKGDSIEFLRAEEQAEGQLKSLSKASSKAGKEADDSSGKMDKLGKALGALATVAAARQLVATTIELYNLGNAADRAETSLNVLTDGSADQYIEAVGDASLGTISKMEIMNSTNRALRLGVVETSGDMEELTRVAAALGRTMGISTTQALNDLVTGIGRASPMILDNLGIQIKLSEVQEDANRMMEENAGITEKQAQVAAIRNAVLAEGNGIIDDMGGLTRDAAAEAEALDAAWQDIKVHFGELISASLTPAISNLNELIDAEKELAQVDMGDIGQVSTPDEGPVARAIDYARMITESRTAFQSYRQELAKTSTSYYAWRDAMQAAFQELGMGRYAVLGFQQLNISREAYDALKQANLAYNELLATTGTTEERMRSFHDAETQATEGAEELGDAVSDAAEEMSDQEKAQLALARAYQAGMMTTEEYIRQKEALGKAYADEVAQADAAARAVRDLRKAHQDNLEMAIDLGDQFDYVGKAITRNLEPTDGLAQIYENLGNQVSETQQKILETQVWGEATGWTQEASDQLWGLQQDLANTETQMSYLENTGQNLGSTYTYVVDQLSSADLQTLGQAWLDLADPMGATTEELNRFYVESGLATQQQVDMATEMDKVSAAVENGTLSWTQGWQAFLLYMQGQDDAVDTAVTNQEELERKARLVEQASQDVGQGYMLAGDDAERFFQRASTAADDTETSLDEGPQAILEDIQTNFQDLQEQGPLALGAIGDSADANAPKLRAVATALQAMRDDVYWLRTHSSIALTATVNGRAVGGGGPGINERVHDFSNGYTGPGGAGGTDFITQGPMLLMVGDNPGGRERVTVTPMSGKGQTKGLPPMPTGASRGSGGMSDSGPFQINLNVDGRTLAQVMYDPFTREAKTRGKELKNVD